MRGHIWMSRRKTWVPIKTALKEKEKLRKRRLKAKSRKKQKALKKLQKKY